MNAYAMTDVGECRKVNQDCIFSSVTPIGKMDNLFIVADGMGGYKAGDVASMFTVETVVQIVKESESGTLVSIVDKAIRIANERLIKKATESEEYEGMGTTLVVATIHKGLLSVANVGDSRLYMVNDSEIRQITRDHSFVEEMVSRGLIERSEARTHEDKNKITRAIGVEQDVMADFFEIKVKEGDKFLMCSDGLSNMIEDEVIAGIVRDNDVKTAVTKLVELANHNGGKDNISVIIIEA